MKVLAGIVAFVLLFLLNKMVGPQGVFEFLVIAAMGIFGWAVTRDPKKGKDQ